MSSTREWAIWSHVVPVDSPVSALGEFFPGQPTEVTSSLRPEGETMTDRWGALFEAAESTRLTRDDVLSAAADRSESDDESDDSGASPFDGPGLDPVEVEQPNPARVVASPAVLVTDLLVGGEAREALDHVRRHTWVDLVASDVLLAETQALVARLADADLARTHRDRLRAEARRVEQPAGDHPVLASAYRGRAGHVLAYEEPLRSAKTALSLKPRVDVSVRSPDAFSRVFDPESLYEHVEGSTYPGPDRDPRA